MKRVVIKQFLFFAITMVVLLAVVSFYAKDIQKNVSLSSEELLEDPNGDGINEPSQLSSYFCACPENRREFIISNDCPDHTNLQFCPISVCYYKENKADGSQEITYQNCKVVNGKKCGCPADYTGFKERRINMGKDELGGKDKWYIQNAPYTCTKISDCTYNYMAGSDYCLKGDCKYKCIWDDRGFGEYWTETKFCTGD